MPADRVPSPPTGRRPWATSVSASTRRGVVALGGALWVALTAVSVLGDEGQSGLWWWALVVGYGVAWQVSRVLVRDVAERRDGAIDEYDQVRRDRVRNVAYAAVLGLVLALYLYLVVTVNLAERDEPTFLLRAPELAFAAFLAGAALPTFLLAWTTPDDED
ncbi:hypothetical protein [Georgenia faecalis]|uniref:DUF3180 family protein n=1 Tax=Georgenia faecalis TaxID=2483799 RepID=A0ABV9D7P6_9MICO|nr:hypothetical protein [Georgenia faecalis]